MLGFRLKHSFGRSKNPNRSKQSKAKLQEWNMDKNLSGHLLDILPEEDKLRFSAKIDLLQYRDSLKVYNFLVERCFTDRVDTFYCKTLNKQEAGSALGCANKFLKHSMLVSKRLEELNSGKATHDD